MSHDTAFQDSLSLRNPVLKAVPERIHRTSGGGAAPVPGGPAAPAPGATPEDKAAGGAAPGAVDELIAGPPGTSGLGFSVLPYGTFQCSLFNQMFPNFQCSLLFFGRRCLKEALQKDRDCTNENETPKSARGNCNRCFFHS